MSYNHTRVDGLEEFVIPNAGTGVYSSLQAEVQEFALALASKIRGIKFAQVSVRNLYVYMEGDLFTMGRIAYGDFTLGDDTSGDAKYAVYSRNIYNTRYKIDDDQRHMKTTGSIKVAVSNALRHLRRYTHAECANAHAEKLGNVLGSRYHTLDNQIDEDAKRLTGFRYGIKEFVTSPLAAEVRGMIAVGHEWRDPSTGEGLAKLFADNSTLGVMNLATMPFKFVRVIEKRGEPYIESMDVPMGARRDIPKQWNKIPVTEYCVRDGIPDALQGSLAVLQMCDVNQYVDNVGMKMCEGGFYVYDTTAE
jgi:hypothetical protein